MKNKNVKFSIIIPTRERCDTLRWSLKTCTEQNYDNLEIIVSDNLSRDATREVVESNRDERIRYVNPGERLSMAHNYEFALSHATGDFVTIIGDDDAMTTNVLDEIAALIEDLQPNILTWDKANYTWSNYYDETVRDVLCLPYKRENKTKKIDSAALLNSICSFESDFTKVIFMKEFPAIYHSFVSRETIARARSENGTFFHSRIPDVYSGIAAASVVPDFWHTTKSYSVRGASSHSIGAAQFSGDDKTESPATQFLQEENIPFHPKMQFCYSLAVMIIESLLQVSDNVSNARKTDFDVKFLIDTAANEAMQKPQNIHDGIVDAVKHIGKVYNLQKYAAEALAKNVYNFTPETISILYGYHPLVKSYYFNGKEAGIDNVYDAARFCEKVLKDNSVSVFLKQNYRFASNAVARKGITGIAGKIRSRMFKKSALAG